MTVFNNTYFYGSGQPAKHSNSAVAQPMLDDSGQLFTRVENTYTGEVTWYQPSGVEVAAEALPWVCRDRARRREEARQQEAADRAKAAEEHEKARREKRAAEKAAQHPVISQMKIGDPIRLRPTMPSYDRRKDWRFAGVGLNSSGALRVRVTAGDETASFGLEVLALEPSAA